MLNDMENMVSTATVSNLVPALRVLQRHEMIYVIQFLATELAKKEPVSAASEETSPVWPQYGSFQTSEVLANLLAAVKSGHAEMQLFELAQPIPAKLDEATARLEQNYAGFDRTEFDKTVDQLDIQESIEELLAALTP